MQIYSLKGSACDPIEIQQQWHRSTNGTCADGVQKHNMDDQSEFHTFNMSDPTGRTVQCGPVRTICSWETSLQTKCGLGANGLPKPSCGELFRVSVDDPVFLMYVTLKSHPIKRLFLCSFRPMISTYCQVC